MQIYNQRKESFFCSNLAKIETWTPFKLQQNIVQTPAKYVDIPLKLLKCITCAAQPVRLATWSIRLVSLNQSTATRSMRGLPAGTFIDNLQSDIRANERDHQPKTNNL